MKQTTQLEKSSALLAITRIKLVLYANFFVSFINV
ncbi:hypothetical protein M6B38_330250 [Iris pallida]|uniref:Uncharacterized protein n=1 Tax=Iris pallida TaxID=29817 RepID=A0AAX6H437_IRIPA|nr:hypothetical protein M6B38_330250 [Iris pallida]